MTAPAVVAVEHPGSAWALAAVSPSASERIAPLTGCNRNPATHNNQSRGQNKKYHSLHNYDDLFLRVLGPDLPSKWSKARNPIRCIHVSLVPGDKLTVAVAQL